MSKILVVEILGISGSGKSYYYKLINNYLKKSDINQKKLIKIQKLKNFFSMFFIEILFLPRNIFLLISIFDYFIDLEHKKNLFNFIKRFLKIYCVYLSSRKNNISINKVVIKESIAHLSINFYKKNPKIFLDKLKKLYRTKSILFIYIDSELDKSLKRMKLRGDNLDYQISLRKKRYKKAAIFHKSLLEETKYTRNKNKINSNLYLNSESNPNTNLKNIISWLKTLYQ